MVLNKASSSNKTSYSDFYVYTHKTNRKVSPCSKLSSRIFENLKEMHIRQENTSRYTANIHLEEIQNLSKLYYIISSLIPEILSFHIGLSQRLEIENSRKDLKLDDAIDNKIRPLIFSSLSAFAFENNIDECICINQFRIMASKPQSLLSNLINIKQTLIYKSILQSTILCHQNRVNFYFPLRDDDLKRRLCEEMMLLGCSVRLNSKLSGMHHTTVSQAYVNNKVEVPVQRIHHLDSCQVMHDNFKSQFTMFMIELYMLCFNIAMNKAEQKNPLESSLVNSKLLPSLAVGSYTAAKEFVCNWRTYLWSKHNYQDFLPNFDEYIYILKEIIEGVAVPVACARCHTPYLFFKKSAQENSFIFKECKKINCPQCLSHCEYIIDNQYS